MMLEVVQHWRSIFVSKRKDLLKFNLKKAKTILSKGKRQSVRFWFLYLIVL